MIQISEMIKMALAFYSLPIVVHDVTFSTVAGQDTPSAPVLRVPQVRGAVDPSNSKQLEKLFGGSVADGDIGIYTEDILYVQDQGETKQSYVTYSGRSYRVMNEADWAQQAGVRVYLGRRHVEQN